LNEIPNPNQDPGAEKRLLLAFALMFLVILIFQPILSKYIRPPQPTRPPAENAPAQLPVPAETSAPPAPKPLAARQAGAEAQTVIDNGLYRVSFTNRGAQVTSWVLKKYSNDKGEPLDLVHPIAAQQYGYPLSLWTYDEELRQKLNSALFVPSVTGDQNAPAELTFEFADDRTSARKTLRFDHSYVVGVEVEVIHDGAVVQAYPSWPAGFGDQTVPASYAASRLEWHNGAEVIRKPPREGFFRKSWIVGGATLPGPYYWAGTVDQYFAAVFMPESPERAALVTLHHSVKVPKNRNKPDPNDTVDVPVLGAAVGDSGGHTRQRLFVGPKEVDLLRSIHTSLSPQEQASLGAEARGPDLEGLVDFGFFGIIARPLFAWLKWTHNHWAPTYGGWGWSIIILTVIINVALFPLRLSSMKSALKMQKVAPQMKAIQEKYKKYKCNDPRKAGMQQEISALYKKEGASPVGGCFPMLLQLPFLFAFYTMLGNAIELRHAPWLWIPDLAAPDPWYVLPFGIAVSMYLLQKMTPTPGMDPVQQKMMQVMMPVMLGGISIGLSSGLGLYWAAGNGLMMVQQVIVNRTRFAREIRAEMEKRAARKDRK
jgi:YidC/Oxa1 family membrane protein insertase